MTDAVDFLSPSDAPEGDPTKVRRSKDGRPEEWLHFDTCPGYWVCRECARVRRAKWKAKQ